MLLRDRMKSVGGWLFRYRSVLPLLALLELPYAVTNASPERFGAAGIAWVALASTVVGVVFRIFVIGFVPRGTSGRMGHRQRARTLNTTGAYSIVRNPLYVGNFFCWTGVNLMFRDPLLIVLNTVGFILFYLLVILSEEAFLEESFGDEYRAFAARVPCLIPNPRLWHAPDREFSLRTVLRREQDTFYGSFGALVGVHFAWHLLVPGAGPIGAFWIGLFVWATAVWLALKALKRFTSYLARQPQPAPR